MKQRLEQKLNRLRPDGSNLSKWCPIVVDSLAELSPDIRSRVRNPFEYNEDYYPVFALVRTGKGPLIVNAMIGKGFPEANISSSYHPWRYYLPERRGYMAFRPKRNQDYKYIALKFK